MSIVFKMDQSKEICVILNQSPDGKIVSFRVSKCAGYKDADLVVPEGDVAIQCSGCREKTRISVAFQPIIKSEEFVVDFVDSPAQDFDWPDDESTKEELIPHKEIISEPIEIIKVETKKPEEEITPGNKDDVDAGQASSENNRNKFVVCLHCNKVLSKHKFTKHQKQFNTNLGWTSCETPFHCRSCKKRFVDQKSLDEHNLAKHSKCFCNICGKGFSRNSLFVDHLKVHEPMSCEPCSLTFKSRREQERHERAVHRPAKEIFNCKICNARYYSENAVRAHTQAIHENNLTCWICKRTPSSLRNLLIHLNKIHRPKVLQDLVCAYCGKSYKDMDALKSHEQTVHIEAYECFHCPMKKYKSKKNLLQHMQQHHMYVDDLPFDFACEKCPERFRFFWQLKRHKTNRHVKIKVPCPLCKKLYFAVGLDAHLKTHQSVEKRSRFNCDLCTKTLTSKHNLKRHLALHRGEVAYECRWCGKKSSTKGTHERHERIHTDERPYACPEPTCDKRFRDGDGVKCHFRTSHTTNKPYKCPLEECGKRFSDRGCYRSHLLVHERKLGITLIKSLRVPAEDSN